MKSNVAKVELSEDEKIVHSGDPWIWGAYIFLCVVSLVEFYSASSQVIMKQGLFFPLVKQLGILATGFCIMYFLQRRKTAQIKKWVKTVGAISFALVILVLIIGKDENGATRSIIIGPLTIQPAELAKIGTAMLVAYIISNNQKPDGVEKKGIICAFLTVVAFAALMFGNGLMNTALLMLTCVAIMWVGGTTLKQIFSVGGMFVVVFAMFYFVKDYQDDKKQAFTEQTHQIEMTRGTTEVKAETQNETVTIARREKTWVSRVEKWYHNLTHLIEDDVRGENAQEMYAHMAQAHGGVLGSGPGGSRECSRLPLAFSDYIFSIVIEEYGLLGAIVLLFVYLGLPLRAAFIANKCAHTFPALLIMGMAIMITMQALTHMAINVGLLPVSGQTLPMISAGGTSIWVVSAAFGIMISVSRHASMNSLDKKQQEKEVMILGDAAPKIRMKKA